MRERHVSPRDLTGKVTDVHAHAGVGLRHYISSAYPYCQSLEGLYYRQKACGVDCNVVFPFSADLHFDLAHLQRGVCVPADQPISPVPYETENRLLFREVFNYCPELSGRFLPFVCADPARGIDDQIVVVRSIAEKHPIYGIKIVPVSVQSPLAALLDGGQALFDFAAEHEIPFLFHVTTHKAEAWSRPDAAFEIAERHPHLRFCLAHCIGFDGALLRQADSMANVWVDTSALKIQVELVHTDSPVMAGPDRRFPTDYSDHCQVMRDLVAAFPGTIVWGTDSPAYSYICDRLASDGNVVEFRLKGTYEDEVVALDALDSDARTRACSTNTIEYLFGSKAHG